MTMILIVVMKIIENMMILAMKPANCNTVIKVVVKVFVVAVAVVIFCSYVSENNINDNNKKKNHNQNNRDGGGSWGNVGDEKKN